MGLTLNIKKKEGGSQDAPHRKVYQIGMAEAHAQTKSILH